MAHNFFEDGDFYIHVFTPELRPGQYSLSLTFERKKDFEDGKTRILGMRHLVDGPFTTRKAAIQAGMAVAAEKIKADDTGV